MSSPECASRTPCSAASTLRRAACGRAPQPEKPVFTSGPTFVTLPMETHVFGFTLRANAPEGQSDFLSVSVMSSLQDLVQGLYQCGSYERGHAYLKEHFLKSLRSLSQA